MGTRKDYEVPTARGSHLKPRSKRHGRLYTEEHTHPASREVVAKDLGYSGISGTSASLIGSLRQYGVLEGRGEGLRVSDDAVVAAYELGGLIILNTLRLGRRMAFKPELFEELRSQFPDRVPSEANLRHILIKKGFNSKQADDVIGAYQDNFARIGAHFTGHDDDGEEMTALASSGPETVGVMFTKELSQGKTQAEAFTNIGKKLGAPLLTQTLVVSIPRNFVVNVAVQGDEIKKEDLAKIKSQFARWIEGLEEAFE